MRKLHIPSTHRYIGEGEPCFVIAEIGANHNRSLNLAKEMIDAAVEAQADAVKFQIYSAETLYSQKTPRHSNYKKNLWELIKEIETPRDWLSELKSYCLKKDIIFFATPFDYQAVDELDELSDLFKVASFEIVDLQLIDYIARKGKPIIISTGLANMEEIEDAYVTCLKAQNPNIAFLQCASIYPAPARIMNLKAMKTMSKGFDVITGLSDHTQGIHISVAAAAMGARIIEKHYTLDRKMEGPDHPFAIEPEELKELVRQIRDVESAFGDGLKLGPSDDEKEYYQKARRSIHAKTDIPKGTIITSEMLEVKRPGLGIKPKYIDVVVGRRALEDIEADRWITWDVI